jgi:hypothetical protein
LNSKQKWEREMKSEMLNSGNKTFNLTISPQIPDLLSHLRYEFEMLRIPLEKLSLNGNAKSATFSITSVSRNRSQAFCRFRARSSVSPIFRPNGNFLIVSVLLSPVSSFNLKRFLLLKIFHIPRNFPAINCEEHSVVCMKLQFVLIVAFWNTSTSISHTKYHRFPWGGRQRMSKSNASKMIGLSRFEAQRVTIEDQEKQFVFKTEHKSSVANPIDDIWKE